MVIIVLISAKPWSDYVLPALGIVISVLTTVGALWWTERNKRKRLTFDYSVLKLAYVENPILGAITLTCNGHEVKDVSLVTVSIRNTGSAPVKSADFESNLQFVAETPCHVFYASASSSNSSISPELIWTEGVKAFTASLVDIKPLLINPGDSFGFGILLSGFAKELSVSARIEGLPKIRREEQSPKKPWRMVHLLYGQAMLAAPVFSVGIIQYLRAHNHNMAAIALLIPVSVICTSLFMKYTKLVIATKQ